MKKQNGFTLLEILLVVALIAILAGIIIVAINPAKQMANGRNAQRRSDAETILNAVYQYSIDNKGDMPGSIPTATTCPGSGSSEICIKDGACSGYVDLSDLITHSRYVVSIPVDPQQPSSAPNGTGYNIVKTADNRIIVCAPHAETPAGESTVIISVSK